MELIKCLILVSAMASVWAESEVMWTANTTKWANTTSLATLLEDPAAMVNYTSLQLSIELEAAKLTTQIIAWRSSAYDYIISKFTSIKNQFSDPLQSQIYSSKRSEESSMQTADNRESQSLFLLQADLLNTSLQLSYSLKSQLEVQNQKIEEWATQVNANDSKALARKDQVTQILHYFINKATKDINGMRSSIIKKFQDEYFKMENGRLTENGRLDQIGLNFFLQSSQLVTSILVANNALDKNYTQYRDFLTESINLMVNDYLYQVNSWPEESYDYHEAIVSYIKEIGQQAHGNLTQAYSANVHLQQTVVNGLVDGINQSIQVLNADLTTLKNQYQERCDLNRQQIKQLSGQLLAILDTVESLISSASENLKQIIENSP